MSNERLVIKSITRKGWLWWSVRWELVRGTGKAFTGGSIDGAPWYVLRRLEEWLEP